MLRSQQRRSLVDGRHNQSRTDTQQTTVCCGSGAPEARPEGTRGAGVATPAGDDSYTLMGPPKKFKLVRGPTWSILYRDSEKRAILTAAKDVGVVIWGIGS